MSQTVSINIRKAEVEDSQSMLEIQAGCLQKNYVPCFKESAIEKWASLLSTKYYIARTKTPYWFYVATVTMDSEEKVVGFVYLNKNTGLVPERYNCELQVESLYIDVNFQNEGIGKKLIKLMESKAIENGCSRIGVLASSPGVGFYKKLGYTAVEENVSFDIIERTFTDGEYSIVTGVMIKDL